MRGYYPHPIHKYCPPNNRPAPNRYSLPIQPTDRLTRRRPSNRKGRYMRLHQYRQPWGQRRRQNQRLLNHLHCPKQPRLRHRHRKDWKKGQPLKKYRQPTKRRLPVDRNRLLHWEPFLGSRDRCEKGPFFCLARPLCSIEV